MIIGPEFVDNIMMSPKYWNLPKPGLIISITGNAADFKRDEALSPVDVKYVMFSVHSKQQPANKVFVPVRKSDCLSDVLFRLSDFSACKGTLDPSHLTTSRTLRNFVRFVSKPWERVPDSMKEEVQFKQEGKNPVTLDRNSLKTFVEKENPFVEFLNSLDFFSTVDVIVVDPSVSDAKNHKFNLFQVVKAVESADVFEDSVLESSNRDPKSQEGATLFKLPVFEGDTFTDLRRRVENMSLKIEIAKDGGNLKYPTLPRPFWQSSTLILYKETAVDKKETKLLQESQFEELKTLSKEDFDNKKIEFLLLRTQGSGCELDAAVIDRILHEVAFLLPLRFGSIWIIDGGSGKGIMKVTFVPRWLRLCPNVLISDLRRCTCLVIRKGWKGCRSDVSNIFDWVCHWKIDRKRRQYGKISGKLQSFQRQQRILVSQEHSRIRLRCTPLPPCHCRRRKK